MQQGIVGIFVILTPGISDHAAPRSGQVRAICNLFPILLLANCIRIVPMIRVVSVIGEVGLNVHPSVRQSRSLIASPAANSALVALLVRVEKELVVVFLAESSPDIPVPDFDLLIHDMLLWLTDS
ncbi:hypothetical protein XEUV354_16420 [Xanthomonas euvesicatoria]|nr:hypothetical protein BHE83_14585 [Xanthomonas euvesicatoria pv. vesicatoria str. 85-10]KHL63288.1 hypothetical protein XEU66b_03125 [Xanthomonas euvesicatoria]KHL64330.1 hypothetical protein XEU83M_17885 [Xanthomonas euvesicatoria]KLA50726.1 hypothetical protein XEUV683_18260 [Xanthomonas euvesicatoria]KLA51409.1 hypothetical protein XEUV685_19010 [Xanthomonas euvesicatoria]